MQENQVNEFPFLCNVGLLLTYKCTIACAHCIVQAGPDRKEEMPLKSAIKWLDEIKDYGDNRILAVSLTGGEPFYNLDHLIQIADHANSLDLAVSVVSNAFWATSKEEAKRILAMCSSIRMISVSTDIPHQKSIPFENVKNAIWAAKKLGMLYRIAVTTENLASPEYLELMDEILEITDIEFVSPTITLPIGRAERFRNNENYKFVKEPPASACSMASFPIIMPNGDIIACIGPPIAMPRNNPLYLGNLYENSLKTILDKAELNHLLHAIRTFGPKELIALLQKHNYHHLLPKQYIGGAICDICHKLFSNQGISELLSDLVKQDAEFRKKTELGRYFYLGESQMLERITSDDPEPFDTINLKSNSESDRTTI